MATVRNDRVLVDPLLDEIDETTELEDGRWPHTSVEKLQEAVRSVIMGIADPDGDSTAPLEVLQQRAEYLAEYLAACGISLATLREDRKEEC